MSLNRVPRPRRFMQNQLLTRRALLFFTLAMLPSLAAAQRDFHRPLVVGHRGLMYQAPECTMAAFRACLALRVGFEFDVRRTRDDELVCLHDATLDRTTNGHGKLADVTLDDLLKLDAGSRFDGAFKNERIPRIDEILALVEKEARGDYLLAVDLKEAGEGLEEKIVRLAQSRKILDRLLFIGLTIESAEVRSRLKAASPQARTARLANTPDEISAVLNDNQSDWVYLRFLPSGADSQRIYTAGKRIFIAGPLVAGREKDNWSQAAALGINAILTDFPLELSHELRNR
jgi:glycerophosphoryl diester phosphodiesterase